MKQINKGDLVRVVADASHTGLVGIVDDPAPETGYDDDRWINFENGQRAPYAPYELEVITLEAIRNEAELLAKRAAYLKAREEK